MNDTELLEILERSGLLTLCGLKEFTFLPRFWTERSARESETVFNENVGRLVALAQAFVLKPHVSFEYVPNRDRLYPGSLVHSRNRPEVVMDFRCSQAVAKAVRRDYRPYPRRPWERYCSECSRRTVVPRVEMTEAVGSTTTKSILRLLEYQKAKSLSIAAVAIRPFTFVSLRHRREH